MLLCMGIYNLPHQFMHQLQLFEVMIKIGV